MVTFAAEFQNFYPHEMMQLMENKSYLSDRNAANNGEHDHQLHGHHDESFLR